MRPANSVPFDQRLSQALNRRLRVVSFIAVVVFAIASLLLYIATVTLSSEQVASYPASKPGHASPRVQLTATSDPSDGHKLAVIVPFRDRFDELLQFIPHMDNFLRRQGLQFSLNIINQAPGLRFNRASLVNAGFTLVTKDDANVNYISIHDVDLLPLTEELSYAYPGSRTPMHLASPQLHPKYNYPQYTGGILLITTNDFLMVDGMSNRYWGWGLEDDEFRLRLNIAGFTLQQPSGVATGRNGTFLHLHGKNRKRDTSNLHSQKEATRRLDRTTGLSSLNFTLMSKHSLVIDSAMATVYTVDLLCNRSETPWCEFAEKKKKPSSPPV